MLLQLKCIKCKYTFTDEKHLPELFNQVRKPENSTPESYLELVIEHIIKSIKCPKCHSPVYWMGIEDKSFDRELDVTSQPIVQLVKAVVDIVENGQSENISKEYMEYASEIITKLIEKPGQLIYIADPDLIRKAETAFKNIWDNVDDEELFNEILYGKVVDNVQGEGLGAIILSDYMERAKRLRPSLLSIEPKEEINAYFQNAMECWLFGINTAALILCCSVIESLLTEAFKKKDLSLTKKNGNYKGLAVLIYEGNKESIIDDNTKEMADNICKLRRLAVHYISEYHANNISETETYNAIMNTKKIIEKILT